MNWKRSGSTGAMKIELNRRQLLAATAALAMPAVRAGTAPRVVALEYHAVEMALALGVTPVGVADPAGYARWVGVGKAALRHSQSVGTRQQPSLERIAQLRPDLIVAVDFRHAALQPLLSSLAPVLLLPSPEGDGLQAVYDDLARMAQACDRVAVGNVLAAGLAASLAQGRQRLQLGGWYGRQLAPVQSIAGVPQLWAFTGNSVPGGLLRALGLDGPWQARSSRQGVEVRTVEDLLTLQAGLLLLSDGKASLSQSPLWSQLPAVRRGAVTRLPGGLWPFGGPLSTRRLAEAMVDAMLA